ncbi:hypothetical protein Tco_0570607 [Tanacetum coccineum]
MISIAQGVRGSSGSLWVGTGVEMSVGGTRSVGTANVLDLDAALVVDSEWSRIDQGALGIVCKSSTLEDHRDVARLTG